MSSRSDAFERAAFYIYFRHSPISKSNIPLEKGLDCSERRSGGARQRQGHSRCAAFLFDLLKESHSPYINRFLSADTIVPGYANPQNLNRYSYVTNNPLRYTDPTGHMLDDGCHTEGCNLTSLQKSIDAQKQKKHEEEAARRKCAQGKKAHCAGDPKEIALFTITSLTGVAALETFVLGGGAASVAETAFWQAAQSCIGSVICRKITGMVGGLNGMRVFRVWGTDPANPNMPGSSPWGRSWSPVDPSTVKDFRNYGGLPSGGSSGAYNTGRFVSEGAIIDDVGVVARDALSLDGMDGGLLEILISNAIQKIQLINVSGVNPPF